MDGIEVYTVCDLGADADFTILSTTKTLVEAMNTILQAGAQLSLLKGDEDDFSGTMTAEKLHNCLEQNDEIWLHNEDWTESFIISKSWIIRQQLPLYSDVRC